MGNKLYKLETIVRKVLEEYPDTRCDDFILIFRVYKEINEAAVLRELFCYTMLNHKEYRLPAFESITRARRKIQKLYPELVDKKTEEIRINETAEYINYAIDGYNPTFMKMVDFKD